MTDKDTTEVKEEKTSIFQEEEKKVEDKSTVTEDDKPDVTKESHLDINSIFADQLKKITDDNGEQKYKDLPTALEALYHSQRHIKTLEQENSEKERKIMQFETLKEAQQNLSSKAQSEVEPTSSSKSISEDEIERVALSAFEKRKALEIQEANKARVESELLSKFAGDVNKAAEGFANKAKELGLSVSDLTELSKKSPSAVLAYFKADATNKPSTTKGSINSAAFLSQKANTNTDNEIPKFLQNNSSKGHSSWRAAGEKVLNRLNNNDYN